MSTTLKTSPRPQVAAEVKNSARGVSEEKKSISPRPQINNPPNSSRGNPPNSSRVDGQQSARSLSARNNNPASDEPIETFRSTMDTARVHTALAALSAERNALMNKLAFIDSALEAEGKRKGGLLTRK